MASNRLRYERSIALHAAVADRLRADPGLLGRARRKLAEWIARGGPSCPLLLQWQGILDRPLDEVAVFLTERSEHAAWLRKASPFAGVLDARERERILREVRRRIEPAA